MSIKDNLSKYDKLLSVIFWLPQCQKPKNSIFMSNLLKIGPVTV